MCAGVRNLCHLRFESQGIHPHLFHHRQKPVATGGREVVLQADGFDEIEFIFQDFIGSMAGYYLYQQGDDTELHVSSTRGGYIPGTHMVMFDSLVDTIELKHTARSRDGFASGAVTAALWLAGKKGFYNFSEIFNTI